MVSVIDYLMAVLSQYCMYQKLRCPALFCLNQLYIINYYLAEIFYRDE